MLLDHASDQCGLAKLLKAVVAALYFSLALLLLLGMYCSMVYRKLCADYSAEQRSLEVHEANRQGTFPQRLLTSEQCSD